MRSSWLYLAVRSDRLAEPVLIWPAQVATARSAMVVSSVSPERCEITLRYPACRAISTASSVSVTEPIWFSLTSSALPMPCAMPSLEDLRVGHEDVVADQLHLGADRVGEPLPARPVAFGQAVLDGDDRVLADPVLVERDHLVAGLDALARLLQHVVLRLVVPELAGGDVERDVHVLAGRVAGRVHRFEHQIDGLAVRLQARREAALIAHARGQAALLEQRPQRMERLGAGPQGLGKRGHAHRHDHEFLEVHVRVGMRTAVEDVHHRHRQGGAVFPRVGGHERGEVLVQRLAGRGGRRVGQGHRHAQDGVGAQAAEVRRAVQRDELGVDRALVGGLADQGLGDLAVHMGHRLLDALAQVAALVAVAQLERLARAGGRA